MGKFPQNAGNAVLETQISKWDFKPIYFAQKCPQNAGNAVSETLKLCRHYGLPLTKILATPLTLHDLVCFVPSSVSDSVERKIFLKAT